MRKVKISDADRFDLLMNGLNKDGNTTIWWKLQERTVGKRHVIKVLVRDLQHQNDTSIKSQIYKSLDKY